MCFQCTSGTLHVTNAISQSCVYTNPSALPLSNASAVPIGWNGQFSTAMDATGVDTAIAETREQYTRILSYDKVRSSSYRRKIASCVGKVNSSDFKGWKSGEVMFMGMSYTTPQKGVKKVKVVFDFAIRPNESNVSVGGINIGDVKGFEYVWCVTGQAYNGYINPTIKYIFKSRVSYYTDFSKLGL